MNILVLSWRDTKHPLAGGAEQVMHEHIKGWIDAGHKVTFFSSYLKNLPKEDNIDGIKIVRNGHQYLGVQIKAFLYYIKNKNKFDLVVDEFHGIPFFTPLYVKKPILAVLQEVAREVWFKNPFIFPINYLVGVIGYLSEPIVLRLYSKNKFVVGSNSAREDLIKFGVDDRNITVVPHGVLLPKKLPKHVQGDIKIITFLGTLSDDKGILDALKAFKILNSLGKYQFWIIGKAENDDSDAKIKEKVKEMNLQVKFWGRVDDKKKFDLLARTFLLINPSIREGWGLVNIEANAVATPVVAYPSQGLIDSVKDGISGIITKSKTPEDLAIEVENLNLDNKKYIKLTLGAKKWAMDFSWDRSRKLSQKLVDSLLQF